LTRGASRRRLRVRRRKRGDKSFGRDVAEDTGSEVVAEFGCCLVEAVGSASILIGLLFVPAFLWLG
jgi:hypothetical protein